MNTVFVVGVFCGTVNPITVEEFLDPFVCELGNFLTKGIVVHEMQYTLFVKAIICDAPARAFVKVIKNHNAYFGCVKCCAKGTFFW